MCVCVRARALRASGYQTRRIIFSKPAVSRRREFRRAEARRQYQKQCRMRRCQEINKRKNKITINLSFRTEDFHVRKYTSKLPARRLGVSLIGEEEAINGD